MGVAFFVFFFKKYLDIYREKGDVIGTDHMIDNLEII